MELVALRIKIGLRPNRNADYPDFNQLPIIKTSGIDWSIWVDTFGLGWCYDKTCGHADSGPDSPRGMQWGCLMVPQEFAEQAQAMFGETCTCIKSDEFEKFYDEKAMAHIDNNIVDVKIVSGLKDTLELMEKSGASTSDIAVMKLKIKNAIDPNSHEPGITKNHHKKWSDRKGLADVEIKDLV